MATENEPKAAPLTKRELLMWGAFGGITPVVAALMVNDGHPFTTYFTAGFSTPVFNELVRTLFKIGVLMIIGGA